MKYPAFVDRFRAPHSVIALILALHSASMIQASELDGALIYANKCAACHGERGQGTPDVPQKLFGDRSAFDLAEVITQSMPEGEPEECEGEEARAVASWMLTEFYSPEAQARLDPPRRSLVRLTVAQYRNCVADLVESFTWFNQPNDRQGLDATYFKGRFFRDKDKVEERLDANVSFDFQDQTPDGDKYDNKEEFSIRWEGSVLIDETGWYDFILQTENGGRVFVNDSQQPLIDAWVKSGDETEFSGSRFLIAGRLYPIKVHWFKFKEKTASVRLLWKPPHREQQPIPSSHLSPQRTTRVLVVETPFPPDDRSSGYIRGTSVSAAWDEATTYAAIEVADKISVFAGTAAGLKREDSSDERRKKIQRFCQTFALRAFRRPLTEEQQFTYVDQHFSDEVTTEDSLRRSMLATLKSPRFLYRELGAPNDLYSQAERLSFALVDSTPDAALLKAAQKSWIESDEGFNQQAWRLANSYKCQVRLKEFLRVWLNLDRLHEADKNEQLFNGFDSELLSDLRTSLELSLSDAVASETGFPDLLSSSEFWVNQRIAEFYGVGMSQTDPIAFRKTRFDPEVRAGIVSHPFLLTSLAYHDTSSPIHRGVFLSRGILGRTLKPPPDSVSPTAPDLEPHLTTRQRVTKQTSPQMCSNCHRMINALGFPLEEFDAVGRHRSEENGRPIDSTGGYRMRDGSRRQFQGAVELARFLTETEETRRSYARQLFHHMVQQPILAYGPDSIDELSEFFSQNNLKSRSLMVEIARRAARTEHANQ